MKKSIYLLITILGLSVLGACSDDAASPIYTQPTTFVLETPAQASTEVDLKTDTLRIECQQPDYGFTASTLYQVEVSLTEDFVAKEQLDTKYRTSPIVLNSEEVALAITNLSPKSDANYFDAAHPLYVRLNCVSKTEDNQDLAGSAIQSNVVKFEKVRAYSALPPVTLPGNVYLIGSVCGWDWAKAYDMVPVHSNEGMFWSMQYLGLQDNGSKAAIKFNTTRLWDGGQVGINDVTISAASKALAGVEGGDNIEIGNPGWYIVVVKVTVEGRSYKYAVDFYKPEVYLMGDTAGGWEIKESAKFTVPTGKGLFESPAFVGNGDIRICLKLADIDWWKTEFILLDGKIAYRGAGGDQERVPGTVGQKVSLNFIDNTGSIQ